jgi:hypothetical protein
MITTINTYNVNTVETIVDEDHEVKTWTTRNVWQGFEI